MNTKTTPKSTEKANRWLQAWHQLQRMEEAAFTRNDIDEAIAKLPPRLPKERLADWLRRSKHPIEADFLRMAASTGDDTLPLLQEPLESADGRFRITVTPLDSSLSISLQAIGLAIDDLAFMELELISAATGAAFASVILDNKGYGNIMVADNDSHRNALLHLQLRRRQ